MAERTNEYVNVSSIPGLKKLTYKKHIIHNEPGMTRTRRRIEAKLARRIRSYPGDHGGSFHKPGSKKKG